MPSADPGTQFIWQVLQDGEWGTIAAVLPGLPGLSPLQTRREEFAKGPLRSIALLHQQATGFPIRLACFRLVNVIEEVGDAVQSQAG